MTVWFSSDLHLGHAAIIDHCWRPFHSVDAMNHALIDNWNDRVAADDTVWVLGDLALGNTRKTIQLCRELKGHKHLLAGNHDTCWHGHKRWRREVREYEAVGFTVWNADYCNWLPSPEATEAFGELVIMSHFPYRGDHTAEERYVEHRPLDAGVLLLHGHVHGAWRVNGRQVNVGVDVWGFAPVSVGELAASARPDPHADCMPGWCVLTPSDPRHENHPAHRSAQPDV
jgi:calcineurin-like phosphoesterase family protein